MGRSQRNHASSNKYVVSVSYPESEKWWIDSKVQDTAGGGWCSGVTWEGVKTLSFYNLDEHEAKGMVSRMLGLGIEGLTANYCEDEIEDDYSGDDW